MPPSDARFQELSGSHASVAAVWSFASGDEHRSLIAADGCFDLIVRADATGRVHAFVYKPSPCAHLAVVEAGVRLIGVRLRPGFGAVLTENSDELRQRADRLVESGADLVALEGLVAAAVEDSGGPPNVIRDFVEHAKHRQGAMRLTLGTSAARERELQRASRQWLGVTPKAYLRIERARAARVAIRQGLPLAAVAADLGFADQSHLTREVRSLLGVTPRRLRPVGILQDPILR